MSGVRRPRTKGHWAKPKQGPLVVAEGLARRPDFLVVPGQGPNDLVSGIVPSTYTSASVRRAYGGMWDLAAIDPVKYTLGFNVPWNHSWVIVCSVRDAGYQYVFRVINASAQDWTGVAYNYNYAIGERKTGQSFVSQDLLIGGFNKTETLAATHVTSTERTIFRNGMYIAPEAANSYYSEPGDRNQVWFGGYSGYETRIGFFALWRHPLPKTLLGQYGADPWQLVQPANRRTWFIPAVVAAGGFKAAWARGANSIISAGVRAA